MCRTVQIQYSISEENLQMKRSIKKLLSLLLAAALLISLLPASAFAHEAEREPGGENERQVMPTGYIPGEIHGASAVSNAYKKGDMEAYYALTGRAETRDTLPSKYDSRDYNLVTSVKNQNPYGSCWAHAAVASIESYMIKYGIPVGTGAAATTSLNLSETQHCFFNYTYAYDAEGMLTGDKSNALQDTCLDQGGNGEMSAYTLMRWTGAADETETALQYSRASSVVSSGLDSKYAYQYDVSHVQNTVWIPGSSTDDVKRAIMEYGAGNISYYETGNAYTYICNTNTNNYANHAITLIGWDDSIAVSNFKPSRPSKPGAWICKNSWGTSQFENGYCYISYEDVSVNDGYIYFYDAEPIDNYQHNYQYDGSCNVVCYGKGWPSGQDYYVGFANNTKVANVFTAKGNEVLRAVAYCNWDEAMKYAVEIYKNPVKGDPSSGTLMSTQRGSFTFAGYYTIPLDTPVALAPGDTFSVVITQNVAVADEDGIYVHTPYDATFNNSSVVSWSSWVHANHGDTSYYQEPGGAWTDCPDNGDYRIKAYTDDVLFNVTAVSNNEAWGTVSVEGNIITASPAEGYYVESCDVLEGNATCSIYINTITVSAGEDCTIRVNFAPKPTYTVNYMVCGEAAGSASAPVNDFITLPSDVADPEGWTFIGWTDTVIADETEEKPAYFEPGAQYLVTGDAILYALFDRVESTGEIIYVAADGLENKGTYILVADNAVSGSTGYAVGNTAITSNHYLSPVAVTINDNTCSATAANLPKVLWTAAGSDSKGYTLYNEAVSKYMGLDSSEYLAPTASGTTWYYTAEGYLDNRIDSEGYYYLSYSDSGTVRYTTGKSGTYINLYKAVEDTDTFYTTTPEAHEHELTHVDAVPATCENPGNIEYWYCAGCGKYFSDAEGNNQIAQADTVIPATGHAWFFVEFSWTATNDGYNVVGWFECANNSAHQTSQPATVSAEVTPATCTEPDKTVYTATIAANVSLDGKLHTESVTVTGSPLGHDWAEPTWKWTETEDGFTAEATFVCSRDASHTATLPANVTCEEDANGNLVYTAVVTGPDEETYRDVKTVELYLVEFKNDDGTVLQSRKYRLGELPVYEGETPVKEAPYHQYTFTGWDPEITEVTGPATYTAQYDDLLFVQISGMTLALEGKIGINFFFKAPENAAAAKLVFHGETETTLDFDLIRDREHGYTAGTETFRLSYSNIAMKEMTCPVTLTVYDEAGGQMNLMRSSGPVEGNALDFCVADWANLIINSPGSSEKSVGLAQAILHFGGTAQNYFGFNLENFANPNGYLNEAAAAVEIDPALTRIVPDDAKATVGYDSFSLNLEGDTEIRIYFTKQVTAKDENGNAYQVIKSGKKWYVSIPGIASVDLDKMFTVNASYGGKTRTLQFCALSYANAVYGSSNENTAALARALYLYNEAAEIYFN